MNTSTSILQIESWQMDRLLPYARNARTHSALQIQQIAASIAEFGFNNPVLADPDGDIIAGHGRVLAARKLGLRKVPVIVLSHLTATQKRAFRLADNQLALNAGWDLELLRLELKALATAEDLALDLMGFDPAELARFTRRAGNRPRLGGPRYCAGAAPPAGHPSWRCMADGRSPAPLRRRY
jgi:ParB-like chromosome segregation protein Spo0J